MTSLLALWLPVLLSAVLTLAPGTAYPQVFRITGVTAFVAYALALWQMSIWYRRAWSLTIKSTFDGLIYALLTAGAFGWLWPRSRGSEKLAAIVPTGDG